MQKNTEKTFVIVLAWSIWLLSAIFVFYKNAIEVSLSVMTQTLMRTFNTGGVGLGNLAACYFFAYLILQIPGGMFLDKWGPRKVTTVSIFLCAFGNLIFASSHSLALAGFGRFLTGAGAAFAVVNCLKLIANWFPPKRFALMAGLTMTMAMLGSVGGQAPLESFIQKFQWRQSITIIGFAGIVLGIIFWLMVRDEAPNVSHKKASSSLSFLEILKKVIKNPQSWWLSIYSGFAFAPVMVFGGLWGVAFIEKTYSLNHNLAAQNSSLMFIGFAVGAPLFGWLSDKIRRRRIVMFWGTLFSLLAMCVIIYLPQIPLVVLATMLFIFGFSISCFLLCFTMIREIHHPVIAATAVGFMNAFNAFVGLFSDPLTGKFLDLQWDGKLLEGARVFSIAAYQNAFLLLPLYLIISLLTLIKIKDTHYKSTYPYSVP